MKKARNAAIVCGMITSFLFGGYFVVEAATVTLDESSADLVDVFYYNENDYQTKETVAAKTNVKTVQTVAETAPVAETTPVIAETVAETVMETEAPVVVEAPAENLVPITMPVAQKAAPVQETTQATTATTVQETAKTTESAVFEVAPIITAEVAPAETEAPVEVAPVSNELVTPPAPAVNFTEEEENAFVETAEPIIFEIPPVEDIEDTDSYSVPTSITEAEYILICNCVANEAGCDNINEVEKAKVVEVIMNRVASKSYPNTIYGVISQKYQFEGSSAYVNLTTFSKKVTPMVKAAVDLYFSDPSAFNHGYMSFYGDGVRNYFR